MAYTTVYCNIIFSEGDVEGAMPICNISSDLSFKIGAQLKNLNDVKDDLAKKVMYYRGNCVTNFTYGQKHRVFAIDDVAFWGKGACCVLPDDVYRGLLDKHLTS